MRARKNCPPAEKADAIRPFRGLEPYRAALLALADQSRLRTLEPRSGIDITSNDYLGLARSARLTNALRAAISLGTLIGSTGSRLLRGNAPEHEELEFAAAAFFQAECALFFGSGYAANFAVFSTLPQPGDMVILDELSHASAREGVRAARSATILARHNDPGAVEAAIDSWRRSGGVGRIWIAVESLYSMDGDRAPLQDLMTIADRNEAFLVIDEAHATGVFGPDGRGLAASLEGRENVIVLHTCGKALGGAGALLTLPRILRDFLVNRCRSFIFSTAPSPLMAVAALESLAILKDEPALREDLARLVAYAGDLAQSRCGLPISHSQILPIIVGGDFAVMQLASRLREQGFDVRGVRPPSVPKGTARLRISITLNVTRAHILSLFEALAGLRVGAI